MASHERLGTGDRYSTTSDGVQQVAWGNQEPPAFDVGECQFKVNQNDLRARLVKDIVHGRTNMYTMFMSLAASSLRAGGRYISITPRSFASGAYFSHFRRQFFNMITPEAMHIFDSRRAAFEDAQVLQENIILTGVKSQIQLSLAKPLPHMLFWYT